MNITKEGEDYANMVYTDAEEEAAIDEALFQDERFMYHAIITELVKLAHDNSNDSVFGGKARKYLKEAM